MKATSNENSDFINIDGADRRSYWYFGPGLPDFLPDASKFVIPVSISIKDPQLSREFSNNARELFPVDQRVDDDRALRIINFPDLQRQTEINRVISDAQLPSQWVIYITGPVAQTLFGFADEQFNQDERVNYDFLRRILNQPDVDFHFGAPIVATALQLDPAASGVDIDPPRSNEEVLEGVELITAVIDDGIGIAHQRFRNQDDTTRIKYYVDMDKPTTILGSIGREYNAFEINQLLGDSKVSGLIDESRFYKLADMLNYHELHHQSVGLRTSHGTHILDIAAGENPPDAKDVQGLIAVQLPVRAVEEVYSGDLEIQIIHAIYFIVEKSTLGLPKPIPTIINLSFGLFAGPHDGTSELENFLSTITKVFDHIRIVLPSGNGNLNRCHAAFKFADVAAIDGKQTVSLPWRIQPNDKTPNHMEIWLPPRTNPAPGDPSRVSVRLISPDGEVSNIVNGTPMSLAAFTHDDDPLLELVSIRYEFIGAPTNRSMFLIHTQPTSPQPADQTNVIDRQEAHMRRVNSGVWTVEIINEGLAKDEYVNIWIERDDTVFGYKTAGRQSYFDDPNYNRFDQQGDIQLDDPTIIATDPNYSHVRRAGMLNTFATAANESLIVVGGYFRKERTRAFYSAGGSTLPGNVLGSNGPVTLAVCEDSRVHGGVLAAGSFSGGKVAMNGTSVAAPAVTRFLSNVTLSGSFADTTATAVCTATVSVDPSPGPLSDRPLLGCGRLDLPPASTPPRFNS